MPNPATTTAQILLAQSRPRCIECGRVFDLCDEDDAAEWAYGHDCEA